MVQGEFITDDSEPLYVLHVLGCLNRGGAETMVMNLYRTIDREKLQFDFIVHTQTSCDYDNEIIKMGGTIFRAPKYNGKNHFYYINWWDKFFKENHKYHILHSHLRSLASLYLPIASSYGLITIAHSHSISNGKGIIGLFKDVMQRDVRDKADYLFACSENAGKWMFGKSVGERSNYRIIPNAIDSKKFLYNEEKRNKIRDNMGIGKSFVIGHVGRISKVKNQLFLLDVFKLIHRKNLNSRLLLIGDGELRKELERKIKRLCLQEAVILAGNRDNVQDYYQAMDVFVFPSLWEGLGIAVIEAQANGLTCIVSDKVPMEVDMGCGLVIKKALEDGIDSWVETILGKRNTNRMLDTDTISKAGYDIIENAKIMQKFYEDLDERQKNVSFKIR